MSQRDLHALDETLLHQAPWPFRYAATSDPRFYDRFWLAGVDPAGSAGLLAGIAYYKNTGVCDGYAVVQRGARQHNSRFSRRLVDDLDRMAVGDLEVQVLEPYRSVAMTWSGQQTPLRGELLFTASFAPYCEAHYLDASTGAVTQEITRYNQIGSWDGWLDDGDGRIDVDSWWAVRDHSWGVRPGVGGTGRSVADPAATTAAPMLHAVLYCATADTALHVSVREDATGKRTYLDGEAVGADGRRSVVTVVDIEPAFVAGSRAYDHVDLRVETADGRVFQVAATPLLHPWAYAGTGYDGGFTDGQGLGVPRGTLVEHDTYELIAPDGVLLNSAPTPPGHRESFARVVVDGETTTGYCTVMTRGALPRYGLS